MVHQDYGVYQIHNWGHAREWRFALQWTPSEPLLVTLNADFARNDLKERQYAVAIWNNASEMRDVKTSVNGTVVDFTRRNTPTDFTSQINETVPAKLRHRPQCSVGCRFRLDDRSGRECRAVIDEPGRPAGQLFGRRGLRSVLRQQLPRGAEQRSDVGIAVSANGGHVLPIIRPMGRMAIPPNSSIRTSSARMC